MKSRILASLVLGSSMLALTGVTATAQEDDAEARQEVIFVLGDRQAYRGNFDDLETPAIDQTIGEDLFRNSGAFNLDEALDL